MKGQFLVGELAVLLQDGAAEHLLRGQSFPAGIGTVRLDEILKDEIHYRRRGIEDRGDLLKLFHDGASCHGGEEVRLGVEFPAHSLGFL